MKKILSLTTICLLAIGVSAQNYEKIKNMLIVSQYVKAKEDFDKAITNEKFAAKAEAYILKSAIYAGLANADENRGNPTGDQLITEADQAFTKYKQMQPGLDLVTDLIYQNAPLHLYSGYFYSGYSDYNDDKFDAAFPKFKKAAEYSDLLIEKKLLDSPVDTNVLILAGLTAQQSNNKEDAAKYYKRLADNRITGNGYEDIYKFLVSYSFEAKDITGFEKYKALGKELFPGSEYFEYDRVDFAAGLAPDFTSKIKALEEILAQEPDNYKANQILAEIIYDTLNPTKEGAVLPANADELEGKMINAFKKSAAAKPDSEIPYLYMGDHFINKAVEVNDERQAHVKDMQARTKPGTKASPEDIKKRDALDKKYGDALVKAQEPYENAADLFSKKQDLNLREKQQYKKVVSYLSDIFAYKKVQAKGNAAEQAKFAAEEKKWNDRYESIK